MRRLGVVVRYQAQASWDLGNAIAPANPLGDRRPSGGVCVGADNETEVPGAEREFVDLRARGRLPDRADADRVELVELAVGGVLLDADHACAARAETLQDVGQQAVVGAVEGGLDEDHPLDAECLGHRQVGISGAVGKGVKRVGDVRVAGLEDVEVGVARVRRQGEGRRCVGLGGPHGRGLEDVGHRRNLSARAAAPA